jgi:hypothetical protein
MNYYQHYSRTPRDIYTLSRTAQPREPYRARREDTVEFEETVEAVVLEGGSFAPQKTNACIPAASLSRRGGGNDVGG